MDHTQRREIRDGYQSESNPSHLQQGTLQEGRDDWYDQMSCSHQHGVLESYQVLSIVHSRMLKMFIASQTSTLSENRPHSLIRLARRLSYEGTPTQ